MSCCSYEKYIESAGGTIVTVETTFPVECHRVIYNAEKDCDALRKAIKGLGTDEATLIEILGHRTQDQRLQIVKKYKAMFNKDLKDDLVSDTSGNFRSTLKALVIDRAEYEASCLYKAMKGLGTDESVLIEILATRSNAEISRIKDAYLKKYKKNLEEDLKGDSSGDFRKLLVSLCKGDRDDGVFVDRITAIKDAEALASEGTSNESVFIKILVSRSYPQLRAIFEEYETKTGKDILATIKSETSGDLKDGLVAIVKAVRNTPAFFAEKLFKTMKGIGTANKGLIRIIVTRCELDMVPIKREFEKMYNKTLHSFVRDDTSGDYRKILLALLHEPY